MVTTRNRFVRSASLGLIVLVAVLMVGSMAAAHAGVGAHSAATAPVASSLPASHAPVTPAAHPSAVPHPNANRVLVTTQTPLPATARNSFSTVDPVHQVVYAVGGADNYFGDATTNALTAFNLTTGASLHAALPLSDPATAQPWSIVWDPVQGTVWVGFENYGYGNYSGGYILVVNASTWSVVGNISSFPGFTVFTPYWMIWDPVSQNVWVEDTGGINIVQLDPISMSEAFYFTWSCSNCYPAGIIDVPTNDTIWVSSYTNTVGVINTSTDSWGVSVTWAANPAWLSGIGVQDSYTGWVVIANDSSTGDVNMFYPNGTFLYTDTGGGGPTYPNAVTFDPYDDYTLFADVNYSLGGGEEIWGYVDVLGALFTHYQDPNATYSGGMWFDSLYALDLNGGTVPYVVTGGAGNGSWLFSINQSTGALDRTLHYASNSYNGAWQVITDDLNHRYFVLASNPVSITAYNLTTGAIEWSDDFSGEGLDGYYMSLAEDSAQQYIYLSDDTAVIYVYNAATGAYVSDILFGGPVYYLADDAAHHTLFAADEADYNVQVIDTLANANSLGTPVVTPGYICALTSIPSLGYFATETCSYPTNSTISIYNGTSGAEVWNFSIWGDSIQGAMSADDAGNLYVPLTGYDELTVVNAGTGGFLGNWTTGVFSPIGVAADWADGIALMTGYYNDTGLLAVNLNTGAVVQSIPLTSPTWSLPAFSTVTSSFYSPMWYSGQMAITALVPLPSVPTGLGATAGNATAALTWAAATGSSGYPITGYDVLWATSASGPWTAGPSSSTTSVTVSGLTDGTKYYFVVESVSAAGTSAPSTNVSATPLGAPYPPTGLTLSVGSASIINASWSAPAHTDGAAISNYTLEWATAAAGPWTPVSVGTGTTHELSGLTASTTYYVKIVAWNSIGASSPSTTASATTSSSHGSGGNGGGSSSSSSPLGLSGLDWIILVVILGVVIAAIAGAMMMRRRRGGASGGQSMTPPGQWSPPPTAPGAPPPASSPPAGPPPGAQ